MPEDGGSPVPRPAGAGAPAPGGADLSTVLRAAAQRLAAAGVPSPRVDAEQLAAHALGTGRGELLAAALRGDVLAPAPAAALEALVARREQREPLQHLTGLAAFRSLELEVGPGVFVPRPETEVMTGLAVDEVRALPGRPVVVDLCTGSGAIALAVAVEAPAARVHAVELGPRAHAWALRNLARHPGAPVDLRLGDAATAFPELEGAVDVVVTNPPYVPPGAVPREVEVREHDPALALYGGGADGLDVPRAVVARAAALLRPGGLLLVEHAEVQQPALLALLAGGPWTGARGHRDLAGAPRCVTARRT